MAGDDMGRIAKREMYGMAAQDAPLDAMSSRVEEIGRMLAGLIQALRRKLVP